MGGPLGRRRHLPLRPVEDARPRSTRSTRRRRRSAARCTWARVLVHAHRHDRPLPAHARPRGLLPDGVGRQRRCPTERRVQNYFGVRCDPSLPYDPAFAPPEKPGEAGDPDQPAELRRAVRPARRRGRAEVRGALAHARALGRLVDDLHDDRRARPGARRSARSCATSRAARRTRPRRRRSGTSTSAPRSRRPSSRTASCRARTTRSRFRGTDGDADIVIETTRPELIPACVALVAHPDDERYSAAASGTRSRRRCSACAVPGARAPARRSREGIGHRDDLHLRRHHRRRVVARAAAPDPHRDRVATAACCPSRPTGATAAPEADARYARARGQDREAGAGAHRRAARASTGELVGEPKPITHPVKFYERGDRPLEIVTSRQWYIRNGGRDPELRDAFLARGRELRWHPPHMRSRYETLGRGAQLRLAHQPAALLRRAVPGLVPARRRRRGRLRRTRSCPPRTRLPGRPVERRARRASPRTSAGKPGGFVADPDVMDTWATSSLTPADRDRLGRRPRPVRPHVPDGPAPAGARDHPHLAVRHRRARALRARRAAVDRHRDHRLGPRPRPQEDVEDQGQRRHADGPLRAVRRRRDALLGGERPPGRRHRGRRGPDEGRSPARDQDPQRVEVRARRRWATTSRRADAVTEPLDRSMLARARRRSSTTRPTSFDDYDYARALERDRAVLLGLLRRLPRAGEAARVRRRRRRRRALGRGRAARSRSTRCCGCSRRSCRS